MNTLASFDPKNQCSFWREHYWKLTNDQGQEFAWPLQNIVLNQSCLISCFIPPERAFLKPRQWSASTWQCSKNSVPYLLYLGAQVLLGIFQHLSHWSLLHYPLARAEGKAQGAAYPWESPEVDRQIHLKSPGNSWSRSRFFRMLMFIIKPSVVQGCVCTGHSPAGLWEENEEPLKMRL